MITQERAKNLEEQVQAQAELLEAQSAALKLAMEALIGALSDDQPYINASQEALAAINALGE